MSFIIVFTLQYYVLFKLTRTQLQKHLNGLMKLYDESIGDRSMKLYESEKLLGRESQILIEWKQKFESLDIVYRNMVEMKGAVDKKQREARLLLYMMNNAARTFNDSTATY